MRVVDDGVHCVKSQAIKVKFCKPIKSVVDEEIANHPAAGTVKVDGFAPRGVMPMGKELGRISAKVVPFRAEMVVDDVEKDHQPLGVGGLQQALQVLGAAIAAVGGKGEDTVISPVPAPGEVGDRHQLNCGDAETG